MNIFIRGKAAPILVSRWLTPKTLLIMRLTAVLLTTFFLQISAKGISQDVTLSGEHMPLKKVFSDIRKQTGYDFIYITSMLKNAKKVTIDVKKAPLNEVLEQIFRGQPFTYTISNRAIIIKEKQDIPAKDISAADTMITVKGIVTDHETNDPLIGVSVRLKNATIGTVTDKDGRYSLLLPDNKGVLVFSFVGYNTQEVQVNKRSNIDIILSANTAGLNEVVVVGYGTQKKRDVTGAIGSINAAQMDNYPGGSINTSMQGKIAGLNITVNSGEPGSGAAVTLRGVSSINGASQPLYIIDGVPIDANTYSSLMDNATFSPLNDLNPQDIASIEVLKDGASASIYGSRASNGVIIITTKSGSGTAPLISFSANTSITDLTRAIGVLNGPEWRNAYIEAIYNQTGALTTKKSVIDSLHPYYAQSQDWQHIMFRQVVQYNADVSVTGSSKDKSMSYYVSAGYKHLPPISLNTKYEQQLGTVRLNYIIGKRITGSTNFNLSNYDYRRIRTGISTRSVVFQNFVTMPVYSPFDPITGAIVPLLDNGKKNPYAIAMFAKDDISRWRVLARQELNFKLLKGLDFNTSIALDYGNTEGSSYDPPILHPANSSELIQTNLRTTKYSSVITENTLTYRHTFKKDHHFSALLGQSYQIVKADNINLRGVGSIDDQISTINGASSISLYSQDLSDNALLSYFGRANYDYKSRYLLSFTLRRDGSSRFGPDKRFGYFPAVSAGWRFTDEPFLHITSSSLLYDGKLRVSYGVTGNQEIGDYAWQGSYARNGTYLSGVAITSNGLPNRDLRWEATKQGNIGVDLAFLGGRFNLNADAYIKTTSNLLFNVQIPEESGYNTAPMNFGGLENKGVELALSGAIIDKTFKWNATITYGINRNKVTELPNNNEDYRPNSWNLARVGQPVGVFYGLKALGIYARDEDNVYRKDQSTGEVIPYRKGTVNGIVYKGGDVRWEDSNGDGVINDDDLQIIGDPNPRWTGGVQNTFSYKNFTLDAFVNVSYGNQVFNELKRRIDASTTDANFSTDQLRRWEKQGDITDVPKLIKGDPMGNNVVSSRFVEDASYIRLQTLSISYRLSGRLIQHIGMKDASVGISGINLLTFSPYKGYDPEVSASANALGLGVDQGSFPKSRSYNFSLNIKF